MKMSRVQPKVIYTIEDGDAVYTENDIFEDWCEGTKVYKYELKETLVYKPTLVPVNTVKKTK